MLRRTALVISAAAGIAGAVTLSGFGRAAENATDPDTLAWDYTDMREKARQDYLAGRVVVRDRWIISEHEAALLTEPLPRSADLVRR